MSNKDNLPMIPDQNLDLLPIEIPDMPFESSPVSKWLKNLSMKQVLKYETNKAEVAKQRNLGNKNYYEMLERTILHPYRLKAKVEAFEDLQRRREYNLQISAQQLKKLVLENHILTTEAKNGDLDFKLKLKELGLEEEDA